ncbi:MAG TPA: penicillin acylase family protein [Candidatus Limnocylindrales bacterium]|nr:penicillin acylase family protein [Candidatus Limnocylindrales bacterium]
MVTSTVAAPAKRRSVWRALFKFLALVFFLVLLTICLAGAWFYHAAHSALAQIDGAIAVPGLQSPVDVTRDAHGVPHFTAANLKDLFFAQGYVTAQDRLWQMDMTRRAVAGDMAEVLPASSGPAAPPSRSTSAPRPSTSWVDYDKRQRILRLRAVADRVAAQLPERDRGFFAAYAEGVNAYIDQHHDNLPIEFRMLRYAPRKWTISDSVLVGIGMSQLLNPQYETEYMREKISQRLSPELMADLYPASSWRDHAPASDAVPGGPPPAAPRSARHAASTAKTISNSLHDLPDLPYFPFGSRDCEACLPGSNNWVISGAHTVTGKPLLSNDMHLPHRVPGVWYEVQLHSGDFNVEGFTLPGMPFVIVGHNQRIAWGFTNLNPDVQDLFIENFNAAGEYETPNGWQKPEKSHEVIHVKDQPDIEFDVTITRHGPIISSLLPGESRQIALQWLVYDTREISIPLFDLDSAQNWEQFRKALSVFATPSQNVVYADVDGNIGYQPMGFVPVRAAGDGTVPVAGADGKHDWTGYLPFDKLPAVFNPPVGIIATANSRITPTGYPYLLATQWFPPYRTERIYKVLESGKKFSEADMLALQTDVTSTYDQFFADRFVYAIDHSQKATARTREAADIMRGFDGRMLADSAAPTIEVGARIALWQILLEPKLGRTWERYEWSEAAVALENIVHEQNDRWLPPGYSNFNDVLNDAVARAVKDGPSDLKSWKYGNQYPVVINHPLFGAVPGLRNLSAPGRNPQSGGGYTVKQVGRSFGPSERMTVDFSNLDGSTFNLVMGESGQILSPYYMDQWPAWYGNTTFKLAYSDMGVKSAKSHELTLTPKSAP